MAATPDGRCAVSASDDDTLRDLATGQPIRNLEGYSNSNEVCAVAVTPDGRRAISASGDHTLKVWDLETGQVLRTLEGHSAVVSAVTVTADGRRSRLSFLRSYFQALGPGNHSLPRHLHG